MAHANNVFLGAHECVGSLLMPWLLQSRRSDHVTVEKKFKQNTLSHREEILNLNSNLARLR